MLSRILFGTPPNPQADLERGETTKTQKTDYTLLKILAAGVGLIGLRYFLSSASTGSALVPTSSLDLRRLNIQPLSADANFGDVNFWRDSCPNPDYAQADGDQFSLAAGANQGESVVIPLEDGNVFSTRVSNYGSSKVIVGEVTQGNDGSVVKETYALSIIEDEEIDHISAAKFGDGKIAVCWSQERGGSNQGLVVAILTPDGKTVERRVKRLDGDDNYFEPIDCSPLSNGNIQISLYEGRLRSAELNSSGAIVGFVFSVSEPSYGLRESAALTFGEFSTSNRKAFVLNENDRDNGLLVYITLPGGSTFHTIRLDTVSPAIVNTNAHKTIQLGEQIQTVWSAEDGMIRMVTVNANGEITKTLTVDRGSAVDIMSDGNGITAILYVKADTDQDIYVQIVDEVTYTKVSCPVKVNSVTAGDQGLPAGAFLSGRKLRFVWKDSGGVFARNFGLNYTPTIDSIVMDKTAYVNVPGSVSLDVFSDADLDPLTLSVVEDGAETLPTGFTWNPQTKNLSWNLTEGYPKGPLTLRVSASDGNPNGDIDFTFDVDVQNRVIQVHDTPALNAFVGDSVVIDLRAWIDSLDVEDEDFDPITVVSVTNLPAGFSYNPTAETISGTVPVGHNNEPAFPPIDVVLTDGTDPVSVQIPVSFPNRPPTISLVPPKTCQAGQYCAYTIPIVESDPDSDELTIQLYNLPTSLAYNTVTRRVDGIPTLDEEGIHSVRIVVRDPKGATAETFWSLTVDATTPTHTPQPTASPDGPPQFLQEFPTTVKVVAGDSVSFLLDETWVTDTAGFPAVKLTLEDPENDPIPPADGLSIIDANPTNPSAGQVLTISPAPGRSSSNFLHLVATDPAKQSSRIDLSYRIFTEQEAKPRPIYLFEDDVWLVDKFRSTTIPDDSFTSPLDNAIEMVVFIEPDDSWAVLRRNTEDTGYVVEGTPVKGQDISVTVIGKDTVNQNLVTTVKYTISTSSDSNKSTSYTNLIIGGISAGVAMVVTAYKCVKYRRVLRQTYREQGFCSMLRNVGYLNVLPFSEEVKSLVAENQRLRESEYKSRGMTLLSDDGDGEDKGS